MEKESELDDCWQERKFPKANTTPLIEIRNSAMWWLNYTHTHTHDDRYLLPFIRVMEKLGSIVQLEMKKREEKSARLFCLALLPGLFHHHRTPNYLPSFSPHSLV